MYFLSRARAASTDSPSRTDTFTPIAGVFTADAMPRYRTRVELQQGAPAHGCGPDVVSNVEPLSSTINRMCTLALRFAHPEKIHPPSMDWRVVVLSLLRKKP